MAVAVEPVAIAPWLFSARTEQALHDYADALRTVTADPADVAATLATRQDFEHRGALIDGKLLTTTNTGATPGRKTAFLFTGQGSQHPGMGHDLYRCEPVFAAAIDEINTHLGDTIFTDDLEPTGNAQPALFALEVALHRLLEHRGITPDIVCGHSIGELAAAHIAGILTLEDACTLVSTRARLMQNLPPGGTMISIRATPDDVTPHLTPGVTIAAINAPDALVISGTEHETHATAQHFTHTQRLHVSHAFHSPLMEPALPAFHAIAETLTYHQPTTPIITTTPGDPTTPHYWTNQIRSTVDFATAATTLQNHLTIELGPHPTLTTLTQGHPTLHRTTPHHTTLATTIAHTYLNGTNPTPPQPHTPHTHTHPHTPHTELPTYPFQHQRHWLN
ncbi:acyltransferase domain-containing protein, partial [Streptomyces sp. NPDC127117]|uniref:acyltransferase domain-containing protein n=1 Tax=Streptomyces sp. NPDC127117 TaxID=3345368 RepID=UPI00363F8349